MGLIIGKIINEELNSINKYYFLEETSTGYCPHGCIENFEKTSVTEIAKVEVGTTIYNGVKIVRILDKERFCDEEGVVFNLTFLTEEHLIPNPLTPTPFLVKIVRGRTSDYKIGNIVKIVKIENPILQTDTGGILNIKNVNLVEREKLIIKGIEYSPKLSETEKECDKCAFHHYKKCEKCKGFENKAYFVPVLEEVETDTHIAVPTSSCIGCDFYKKGQLICKASLPCMPEERLSANRVVWKKK